MTHLISHGWNIRFHPLFSKQRLDLVNDVKKIKARLSEEKEYRSNLKGNFFIYCNFLLIYQSLSIPFFFKSLSSKLLSPSVSQIFGFDKQN